MQSGMTGALYFLIGTLFDMYLIVLILRFLFPVMRISGYNQIAQLVLKLSNPLVRPLQRFLPQYKGLDLALVLLIVLFSLIKIILLSLLLLHAVPGPVALFILAIRDGLDLILTVFIYALIIRVIISWVNPSLHNPGTEVLTGLTEPLLQPIRQFIPPFSGIDLSPMVALIVLSTLKILI